MYLFEAVHLAVVADICAAAAAIIPGVACHCISGGNACSLVYLQAWLLQLPAGGIFVAGTAVTVAVVPRIVASVAIIVHTNSGGAAGVAAIAAAVTISVGVAAGIVDGVSAIVAGWTANVSGAPGMSSPHCVSKLVL